MSCSNQEEFHCAGVTVHKGPTTPSGESMRKIDLDAAERQWRSRRLFGREEKKAAGWGTFMLALATVVTITFVAVELGNLDVWALVTR